VFLSQETPLYGGSIHDEDIVPVEGHPDQVYETFNYQLALDMDWESMGETDTQVSYDVRGLVDSSTVELAVYDDIGYNQGSNPYRYVDGADPDVSGSGTATYDALDADELAALFSGSNGSAPVGGQHYSLTFNLTDAEWFDDLIDPTLVLWMHFTQECGNDDGMGKIPEGSVPEPFSMVMLGCLGAGMLGARKARQWRKAAK
jgi:hypothetical protein